MFTLQSNRRRHNHSDAKQHLRAHIDQLSLDRQREFVAIAKQLIAERSYGSEAESNISSFQSRQNGR